MLPTFLEGIEISKIEPPARSVRHDTENSEGIDELAISINEKGLLQPVIVRPVGNRFEVVAGNRRLEACKKLGWRKVTCHVVELSDREAYEVSLIENLQRKTMNPIEEAENFRNYVESYGYGGVSELAKRIGKSQAYVSRMMRLLDLPERIKVEVLRRRINPSIASELLTFNEEEINAMQQLIIEKKLKRSDIRIMKRSSSNQQASVSSMTYGYYLDIEKKKHDIQRALDQSMAAIRTCMIRVDDVIDFLSDKNIIEDLGDVWILRELLMELRLKLHNDIGELIKMKQKLRKKDKCA